MAPLPGHSLGGAAGVANRLADALVQSLARGLVTSDLANLLELYSSPLHIR